MKQEANDDGWLVTIDGFEDALILEWPANSKSASCYGNEAFVTSFLSTETEKPIALPITIYVSTKNRSDRDGLFKWKNKDGDKKELPLLCSSIEERGKRRLAL